MKKQLRKLIRENINALFEFTAAEKQTQMLDVNGDIERGEKLIDFTKKEEDVAKNTKLNIDKTKSNIVAISKPIQSLKKTLAAKESSEQGKIAKEKRNVIKDLEAEKAEDEKKLNAITNMETNNVDDSDVENENTPDTPDTPDTPSAV